MTKRSGNGWLTDYLFLAAIWGSSFIFMKTAAQDIGPVPTAAFRATIAAAFLLPFLLIRNHWAELCQHWKPILWLGILNSALPFVLYSFAVQYISTGLSAILNATVPLFGAIVARVWLGDKLNLSRSVGLLVGFGGVVWLTSGQAHFNAGFFEAISAWAIMACLAATSCYAVAASFTKKHIAHLTPLVMAAGSQIAAALVLILPAIFLRPDHWPSLSAWGALMMVGVLCTGVAYILFFRLIKNSGPARALTVTFLVPVFAVAYGVILFSETVTLKMLLCGLVILLGTALSSGFLKLPR